MIQKWSDSKRSEGGELVLQRIGSGATQKIRSESDLEAGAGAGDRRGKSNLGSGSRSKSGARGRDRGSRTTLKISLPGCYI